VAPGDRIRQQDIADRLGISATPVREAIWQLETEGYLESIPHVGVRVAERSPAYYDEIFSLRLLLEGRLAATAAEQISDDEFAEISALNDSFAEAVLGSDSHEARRLNYRFHRRVWEIARLPVTRNLVDSLWAKFPWDILDDAAGRGQVSLVEHKGLVEALEARDAEAARAAVQRHIESSRTAWPEA
jgi:DNA-binding GntR family transcriptional regulator